MHHARDIASPDLAIVWSPVGGGHRAAAEALAERALARGLRVETIDAFSFAPRCFGRVYVGAHCNGQKHTPQFYGQRYEAANRTDLPLDPLRRAFDHVLFRPLVDHLVRLSPRAIIATHHLPLTALGRARRHGLLRGPLTGVVTDYCGHAVWVVKGIDLWAAAGDAARGDLIAHGASVARIVATGIPVKRAFEEVPPWSAPGPGEALRVLVTTGGFGVGPLREIVRSFAAVARREGQPSIQLTVVCGRAPEALRAVEHALAREDDAFRARVQVLGFEPDMASRMAESHLVVGKAGGLTVTESLTAGRPLVLVGSVPGNETRNESFVLAGGAGVSALAHRAGEVAARLFREGELERMARKAKALLPKAAADAVLDRTLAQGSEPGRGLRSPQEELAPARLFAEPNRPSSSSWSTLEGA